MAFETRMLQECTDFWTNHVETNVPPPFDDGKGTQAYLRLVHGEVRLEGVGLRLRVGVVQQSLVAYERRQKKCMHTTCV